MRERETRFVGSGKWYINHVLEFFLTLLFEDHLLWLGWGDEDWELVVGSRSLYGSVEETADLDEQKVVKFW